LLYYSPDGITRINEALTDSDLTTYIDYTNNVLFRRVKHFSGYVVAERDGAGDGLQ
jgi:hypothetical protein